MLIEINTGINVNLHNDDSNWKSFDKLLKAICYDPVIHEKVFQILKLDSYQRRIVLSNWLEQLRRKNAPENLTKTLSYLFDDVIAQKIFTLINRKEK